MENSGESRKIKLRKTFQEIEQKDKKIAGKGEKRKETQRTNSSGPTSEKYDLQKVDRDSGWEETIDDIIKENLLEPKDVSFQIERAHWLPTLVDENGPKWRHGMHDEILEDCVIKKRS